MSCVDLSGFDEYCRRSDAYGWKFLGYHVCFLTGNIGWFFWVLHHHHQAKAPFNFVLLRLLHLCFLINSGPHTLDWIAAWRLIWIGFIMSCGIARCSIMSRGYLHDNFDTFIFHTSSWLSGYLQGKFQGLAIVGCNAMSALGPGCVHSGQFLWVLHRSDTVGIFLL